MATRIPVRYRNPRIRISCTKSVSPRGGYFHRHVNEDWEICYTISGETTFRVENHCFKLGAGELVIVRPGQRHQCLGATGKRCSLVFRDELLKGLLSIRRGGKSCPLEVNGVSVPATLSIPSGERSTLEYLQERLSEEEAASRPDMVPLMRALLTELLVAISRWAAQLRQGSAVRANPAERDVVERLCAEVRANLARPWTLAALVRRSGYSSSQLTVLFRKVTGLSPCRWCVRERIRRACNLLAHSNHGVLDIASECGFGSRYQFHRMFTRSMRLSARRFRLLMQQGHA